MIVGYSLLEGIGSALMIPPIYILVTVVFQDVESRAKNFGIISGAAGLGAAAGPLLGGVITSSLGWRASFVLQVLVVGSVIFLARRIVDPGPGAARPAFDLGGAVLSAAGLFFVVLGILQSGTYGWFASSKDFAIGGTVLIPAGGVSPVWLSVAIGVLFLLAFFLHIRSREKAGKEPLLHLQLFANRTANLGLGTQLIQWLTMQGSFFVISVYLQQVRGYNAIQTGLTLTPTTVGILVSSALAGRFAKRHSQRWLIQTGFSVTVVGMVLLLVLGRQVSNVLVFAPGLLLMGVGVGAMLTSSVNVVQSSFPDRDQDDISGLSRSISNLGSSLGTALAGSILVAAAVPGGRPFSLSLTMLVAIALIGLMIAMLIPRHRSGADVRQT
jgi:MFS family permease